MQKQTFTFLENKTFFGLDVFCYGVKLNDIQKLPFYDFWNESAMGSTCAIIDEVYVYLHDWENFCYAFISKGTHRYLREKSK